LAKATIDSIFDNDNQNIHCREEKMPISSYMELSKGFTTDCGMLVGQLDAIPQASSHWLLLSTCEKYDFGKLCRL
jgi:hypothetical protein